jgi:lipopolysaccharide biosynthesis regulator YciM
MVALLRRQRDMFMKELALEYVRQKRTDRKTMLVLEQVVADPNCDRRWLVALAKIYVQRREWGKLKLLRQRVEAGGQAG